MKTPTLESARLILRPLSLEHLSETYVNWMNDPEVFKHMASGGNYTFDMLRDYLEAQEKQSILFWAIHIKETGAHIGNIKIDPINEAANTGEYGIMIGDRSTWGKGYAKEASQLVIDYCFSQLKFSGITLGVLESNEGAVMLYKKMNFATVGHTQDAKGNNAIRMLLQNAG